MFEFGLKLWSTNENYIEDAIRIFNEGYYNYIELYVVPDSEKEYMKKWKRINIPYIVHAPHFMNGMNLAVREKLDNNMILMGETQRFADELGADMIIFHPGIEGDIAETVEQINKINDARLIVENKPYYTIYNDGNICNGNSPVELEYVLSNTNTGFCLDLGHAIYAANARSIDYFEYIKKFLELKPEIFHLTDGISNSIIDAHLNIGKGDFDIGAILGLIPKSAKITIETTKNLADSLNDFKSDIDNLRTFFY